MRPRTKNSPFQFTVAGMLVMILAASTRLLLGQADNYGAGKTAWKPESTSPMHFVLVMKSPFDIGYSA